MPTQKQRPAKSRAAKPTAAKRPKAASRGPTKTGAKTGAKTRALSVSDAVLREPAAGTRPVDPLTLMNPLAVFEPLRREVADRQTALVSMVLAWSPARMLINQQAAFWQAFAQDAPAPARASRTKSARKAGKRGAARG
jgi:hypothetical protein